MRVTDAVSRYGGVIFSVVLIGTRANEVHAVAEKILHGLAEGAYLDGADDGDFSSLGVGLDGAYQFNLLGNPAVQSYAGAGIVWFQEIDIDFEGEGPERSYSGDDIGIQVFLGARYALNDRWSLHAEARYLTASGIEMDGEGAAPGSFEADYDRTSVTAGLSYRF